MTSTRNIRCALVLGGALLASCGKGPPAERVVWMSSPPGSGVGGDFSAGDIATGSGATWLVYGEGAGGGAGPSLLIRRVHGDVTAAREPVLASLDGASPGLVTLDDGSVALVSLQRQRNGDTVIVLRRGSADGRTWSAPRPITTRPGRWSLASGRFLRTHGDSWLVPAVWNARDAGAATRVVCLRSEDAGATWSETPVASADGADPAIAETSGGKLLLVLRQGTRLARSESSDGGVSWSGLEPIGIDTDTIPHALEGLTGGVALAWTDPPPDSSQAVPGLRALRLAVSTDAGHTWHRETPLAWRAGAIPECPALAFDESDLTAFFATRAGSRSTLACVAYDLPQLENAARSLDHPRGRYSIDPERATDAYELLCAQILDRPAPSIRLFIEGYFMRALVTASEVLAGAPKGAASTRLRTLDTQQGLVGAVSFADWMLDGQDADGYWPLGYKAVYVADMAAVIGLYAALVPHVDAERVRRYERSAGRFAAALERDGMLLPSGACGIGWIDTRTRSEATADRTPYLVSTALAGVQLHAWLYSRTHDPVARRRAQAALDYTLAALRPDGSLPGATAGDKDEGSLLTAAYVEEGWLAADRYLDEPGLRDRWRSALPPHVAWLLRTQKPDGTWGSTGDDGEFARTPAILSFLIWYDERVERRDDVRRAVLRASVALVDPDRWPALGLARAGKHEEVMRALTARPLAAMAADRFVF